MNLARPLKLVPPQSSATLWIVLFVGAMVGTVPAPAADAPPRECRELDDAARARIVQMAARQLRTEPAIPTIDREVRVPETCYTQLFMSAPAVNRKFLLYVSPDLRFLSSGLWDITKGPEVEELQNASRLIGESKALNAPSRGPDNATVTAVVFSDFQCPYCKEFARMVAQYQKANPDKLKVIFRNFPLEMHPWAEPAARAGLCISQQSPSAFWRLHDALYRDQQTTSLSTLDQVVAAFVAGSPELDPAEYAGCMSSAGTSARLDRDLAAARAWGVQATPTVFINGRRYAGFPNEAAFVAAVEQAAQDSSAVVKERLQDK